MYTIYEHHLYQTTTKKICYQYNKVLLIINLHILMFIQISQKWVYKSILISILISINNSENFKVSIHNTNRPIDITYTHNHTYT